MLPHDPPADREPQTRSFLLALRREEGIEDPLLGRRRDRGAVIVEPDGEPVAARLRVCGRWSSLRGDPKRRPALTQRVLGVHDDVQEDLLKLVRVCQDPGDLRAHLEA